MNRPLLAPLLAPVLALLPVFTPGCVLTCCVNQLVEPDVPAQEARILRSQQRGDELTFVLERAATDPAGPRDTQTLRADAPGLATPLEVRDACHWTMHLLLGDLLFGPPTPRFHRVGGQDAAGRELFLAEVPFLEVEPGTGAEVARGVLLPFAVLLDTALLPLWAPLQLLVFLG